MKIRPLHDRIVAKRLAEEEKTSGGLFIPDTAKEKPLEAQVIAVGDGKILENGKTQPLAVHVGDQPEAAAVVLESRVVQRGHAWLRHLVSPAIGMAGRAKPAMLEASGYTRGVTRLKHNCCGASKICLDG